MKIRFNKSDFLRTLKNVSLVVLGTLILAFGTSVFLLPFDLVTGGVSGYSIVIKNWLPFEFITKEMIIAVLTWTLFFIGFIVLGKDFAAKSLISTIFYPIFTAFFSGIRSTDFMNGFFRLEDSVHSEIAILLAAIFSGVFVGLGCALSFLGGGSTGGVDVIAFTLCKIFKRVKSSVFVFAVDATAVVLGMFVIGDFVLSLLGIVSAFIAAMMIDKVFVGGTKAFVAHIVTEKYEEINELIIKELDRTTTIFSAKGGYSGEERKVVMVSFTMDQYAALMAIVTKVDREAFMTINQAHEINGEGFSKHDLKPKK
ncbi:MAG: YitT family protein [Clostridia bacterium]|nr:YitT family protein [Clostridia bacterium]